jgi:flavin-dependent dehydrogenase
MGTSVNFDVVIVGAGPAGTSTAISCRKAGLNTAVLESAPFPRFQVGESLHPGAEVLLDELGVANTVLREGFLRYEGIWTHSAGRRRFTPFGSDSRGIWKGFQIDRARFDAILLRRACQAGAHFFSGNAHAVHRTARGILIESDRGPLTCRIIVDATGSRRWVARQLKMETVQRSPNIIARYGYCEGRTARISDCSVFTFRKSGWQWIARIATNRFQWISVSWARNLPPHSIPKEMKMLRPISRVRGADVTWRILRTAAAPDFFAVGDAASVLDPASSHGILKALSSGVMAAHCMKQILTGQKRDTEMAAFYDAWVQRSFANDARRMSQIYLASGAEMRSAPEWRAPGHDQASGSGPVGRVQWR